MLLILSYKKHLTFRASKVLELINFRNVFYCRIIFFVSEIPSLEVILT